MSFVKTYSHRQCGEFNKKEISRYAGNLQNEDIIDECIAEISDKLSYKVCGLKLPLKKQDNTIFLGEIRTNSVSLARYLKECDEILLFAATIGIEIDRLIMKYSKLSPVKALVFQAIGAERIERLCDVYCEDLSKEEITKPRFSPGYGDFSLEIQKEIFAMLDCNRKIGLTLNDSMLMSPTKSVTAIVGIISK